MNTDKKLAVSYTVIGILAIALIIALFTIFNHPKSLAAVYSDSDQAIAAARVDIGNDCTVNTAEAKKKCADDLQSLSDLLAKVQANINTSSSTAPLQ